MTTEEINNTNANGNDRIANFNRIRNSAQNGNRENIEELIVLYRDGDGTDPDQVKVFEWLLKAVKLDPPINNLYYDMALAHLDGVGTSVNLEQFKTFMEKAADENKDIEAMFQLAKAYEKGTFGKISLRDSFYWTYKMAEAGDPGAMILVSRAYKTGRGVIKSQENCKAWAEKAVEAAKAAKAKAKADIETDKSQNWVEDDLPRALAQRAEAERSIDNEYQEFNESDFLGQAAGAAIEFITGANQGHEEYFPDVIEIMVRHVKRLELNDGEVSPDKKSIYIDWIEKISCAIEDADNNLLDKLSADLKLLIYNLACAYQAGTGVKKDEIKYYKWLAFAAKIKSPKALYELASKLGKTDPNHQRYLEEAKDFGNIDAYITLSLDRCKFSAKKNQELFGLFIELVTIKNNIKKRHLLKPGDHNGLAHYTDQIALNSMLAIDSKAKRNVLRLYNIAYVNDPDEGKPLVKFEMDNGLKNPLAEFFKDSEPNDPIPWKNIDFFVHIGSFSSVIDKLPLWRAYGRDGNGYCVTIPNTSFLDQQERLLTRGSWESNIADKTIGIPFYKVLYGAGEVKKTLNELSPILSRISATVPKAKHEEVAPLVRVLLSELLYLYKNEEYSSEEEVRVIQRTELSNPLLNRHVNEFRSRLYTETSEVFFEIEGSEIIIGPKVVDKAAAMIDIKHNLALNWWDGTCKVRHSKIRYR